MKIRCLEIKPREQERISVRYICHSQSYNRYSYCLNNPLKFTDPSGYTWWGDFWGWVGNGFKNLGNWMTRNNIQVRVGVNISGDGTVPFAGITGPNNFNVNTQNFVKQPTAAIQSIHQQIAMFSRMSTCVSPEWNMPMQQFVGESPLAGGVASSEGNTFGNMISGVGLGGYVASNIEGTFRITSGVNGAFSPKYYGSGWKGGSPARIATYSVSKVGIGVSTGASALSTGLAYYDIFSGGVQSITYADATVGTVGLTASVASYFSGAQIPGVGYFVAIYGATRLGYDIGWNLGVQYGPSTWFKPRQPESRVLEYMRQNGLFND